MTENSCLKIKLKKIASSCIDLKATYKCFISIKAYGGELVQELECSAFQQEIRIDKSLSFALSSQQRQKDSICTIEIRQNNELFGKLPFTVIDYAYYFKTIFVLENCRDPKAKLYMSTNIYFTPQTQTNQTNSANQPFLLKISEISIPSSPMSDSKTKTQLMNSNNIVQSTRKQIDYLSSDNISRFLSKGDSKQMNHKYLQVTNNVNKKNKNEVDNFKSMIQRKNIQPSKQIEFNFSMRNISTKKQSLKKPTSQKIGIFQSVRAGAKSSAQKDSQYCKDLQQNLTILKLAKQEQNNLSMSRCVGIKKEENEVSLYTTLVRLKDKFQKIHNDQTMLHHSEKEYQYSLEDSLQIQDNPKQDPNHIETVVQLPDKQFSQMSVSVGPSVNSGVNHFKNGKFLHFYRSFNIFISPINSNSRHIKKQFEIQRTVNFQFITIDNPNHLLFQEQKNVVPKTRFKQLINQNGGNKFDLQTKNQSKQNSQDSPDIKQQPMQQIIYVKLNSFNYLTKAQKTLKLRNTFLMQVHDEMLTAQRKLEEKLEISKNIIAQKEDVLNHEFEKLKKQINQVTLQLFQTNIQAKNRQDKIISFQNQIQKLVRENNKLKAQINAKDAFMRQLRFFLAADEQKYNQQITKNHIQIQQNARTPFSYKTISNQQDVKKKQQKLFIPLKRIKQDKRISFQQKMLTSRKMIPNKEWSYQSFDYSDIKNYGNKRQMYNRFNSGLQSFVYEEKKLSTGEIFIDKVQTGTSARPKKKI